MIIKSSTGFVSSKVLFGIASAGMISFAWWLVGDGSNESLSIQPMFEEVKADEFVLEITEPGEIESAENVEIRCEVM